MAEKKLGFVLYLMDREQGTVQEIKEVPDEVKEKWSERLSQTMSEYYTQHMDEYVRL